MLMTCRSYSQSQSENHFCPLHDDVPIKEVLIYCRPSKNQFTQAKTWFFHRLPNQASARLIWQAIHGLHENADTSVFP